MLLLRKGRPPASKAGKREQGPGSTLPWQLRSNQWKSSLVVAERRGGEANMGMGVAMAKGVLYDANKCIGCRGCQAACKQWNENDEIIPEPPYTWDKSVNRGSYENPPQLSARTWTKLSFTEL